MQTKEHPHIIPPIINYKNNDFYSNSIIHKKNCSKSSLLIISTVIMMLFVPATMAQDIPDPMYPYRLVNDFANVFSSTEQSVLEQKLLAYNDSTSTQIYVVTVNSLGGYATSDFTFRLAEKWEIGQKGKDNGVVILIKPKVGNNRGQAFIAIGYGLEAKINDAYAGRIVRNHMIPYFIEEDYFGGANAAVDAIIERLSGEFSADEKHEEGVSFIITLIILGLILFFLIIIFKSGKGGGFDNRGGHNSSTTPPIFFPNSSGRRHGGNFGGRGFGGGGGGRFGGGGAGSSW